jgi:transcriptional antiterminator NusG
MTEEAKWFVVHTYSGYENKVKANIEKIVENRGMHEQITEITVPVQDVVEIKNGQKKVIQRKVLPGYVLVKMLMNDDTWYVVRNTRGVTSFVGPGSKPVPLTEEEVMNMGIKAPVEVIDIHVGETVKVTHGPFEGSLCVVKEINHQRHTLTVKISVFGRETPVELDFTQIQKVS